MERKRRYLPVVRARRLLLLVLAVVIAAVAASWLIARRDLEPDVAGAGGEERPRPKGLVLAGEGFDYELSDGERTVFRIQADRILSDRRDNITLEQARVVVTREDSVFEAYGDRAEYTVGTSNARLVGNARVVRGDGLELRARELDLIEDGKVVVTAGKVSFGLEGAYRGAARRVYYDLEEEILQLTGEVSVESLEGGAVAGSMKCNLLVYERGPRVLRMEGDVVIQGRGGRLSARRLTVHLDEEEKRATFVRAFWSVSGELKHPGGGDMETEISFEGNELSVLMADGEPASAQLDPAGGRLARLTAADSAALVRRVVAPHLTADFAAGVIQIVRAYDGVEITEHLAVGSGIPLRSACGRWLLAGFDPAGEIEDLVLQHDVDYQEPGLQMLGDRVERGRERSVAIGRPAYVRTDRGEVQSPRIVLAEREGRLEASDGVRAELPRGGKFRLIGEQSEEPIRITAVSAVWTESPWRAEFRDTVRAWQGENYLVANRMIGLDEGERLEAEGAVKTVVRPRPEAPAAGAAPERRAPVEVTAERMVYVRPERVVTYSGRPRAFQAGRTVTCDELDILLGEQDRFDSLRCRGGARLENPERGQTVEGTDAVYRPDSGVAEISGAPVILRDRDGGVVRGKLVLYDFDKGTAQVRSEVGAPEPAPPAASEEPPTP